MKNQPKSTKFKQITLQNQPNLKRNFTNKLCCFLRFCGFVGLLVCPAFMVFLSLKYSFAASLHLSRHFLFLLLRVGLCLLVLSSAQNLLAIDNLANFSWRIAEIKWLSLCLLANLLCNKYLWVFALSWLSFGLRHEFALHS